ncbi:hypothetical protein QQS21_004606 [Conoideocrella luteorostrata]|uniref:FAD-binding domain-containing protein n=1 Tax=Conoideocrella luteorostrata TaxID=1105319 RepID=A0AAJ0CV53_9HYPO|nr:hypothetical protein QQS21_004606 [Conoideocrella luteorostrata]
MSRVELHEALKKHATDPDGSGPPAVLETSAPVSHIDAQIVTITLKDGTRRTGDLVLGADGVGSLTRKTIVGESIKPFSSGKNAFRFLIPWDDIVKNKVTRELAQEGHMSMWIADDRRELSSAKPGGSGWGGHAKQDVMLSIFKCFGPQVQELLSLADSSSIKVWTLLDMDTMPTWVQDKLALLGDAAHPFLPHQGQGGVSRDDIPERLLLYEKIRAKRAHNIQEITRRAGLDLTDETRSKFDISKFFDYNFGHDEFHNSAYELKKFLQKRHGPAYHRQPIAFGPLPSPRQDHLGRSFGDVNAMFTCYTIRFNTSATYLKTLFPNQSFSFQSSGTIAQATWSCCELSNLAWLGGKGYRYVGLWIEGIQYTKKDGSKLYGSYLPVLFENSCDPILTGRDELGMPKLFCDINVKEELSATTVACSRDGTDFFKLTLQSLQQVDGGEANGRMPFTQSQTRNDQQFVYRCVPAVGKPGILDAEYTVSLGNAAQSTSRVVEMQWRGECSESNIWVEDNPEKSFSTLHGVISDLSEVPVYDILEVKVEKGHGVDTFSGAQRVE